MKKTKDSYDSLSEKYRKTGKGQLSKDEVDAYLVARYPATYAVNAAVLNEIASRIGGGLDTLLDLGAGLGAGAEAASDIFPLKKTTLIEKNQAMYEKGKERFDGEWILSDLKQMSFQPHDLVLFSYSYGELDPKDQFNILEKAWEAANVLVIIEPGVPRGYNQLMSARDYLIKQGGHLIAPCPHESSCPLKEGRWCHFSKRVQRTKEHQLAKGGKLSFEDEKYSYIAFSKSMATPCTSRIISHPKKSKGQVFAELCTKGGIKQCHVSKKDKETYKLLRKANWGDGI